MRLVAQGLETKEIAIALGLNPRRVDKIISSATAKLGKSRRKEAARLLTLAEHEGGNDFPGETLSLLAGPPFPPIPIAQAATPVSRVREEPPPFTLELGSPLRKRGNAWNDLTPVQRVMWTILLACVAFSAVGILALGLSILSH